MTQHEIRKSEITENEMAGNGMTSNNQELTEHEMTQYQNDEEGMSQTKWREKSKIVRDRKTYH